MFYQKNTPVVHTFGTCPAVPYTLSNFPAKGSCLNNNLHINPYSLEEEKTPNLLLLTPAIFGTAGMFILGFGFYGHSLTSGYSKFIFFIVIYAIIASLGAGLYIYQLLHLKDVDSRLYDIVQPLLAIAIFFAATFNLVYSLYPSSFSGTIGDTKITQFLSFLALSIGSISVGETFDVSPQTAGVQILLATESFWNLFAISILISLLV
ncbi:MAG: hypothetical protein GX434_08885 [Peptococcaceae bacterium]|nr:hypothetical protein [Peptococcaceae bacterium]